MAGKPDFFVCLQKSSTVRSGAGCKKKIELTTKQRLTSDYKSLTQPAPGQSHYMYIFLIRWIKLKYNACCYVLLRL